MLSKLNTSIKTKQSKKKIGDNSKIQKIYPAENK